MMNREVTQAAIEMQEPTSSFYNNKVAIILNGPPGCGKDTIAKLLCDIPHKQRCEAHGEAVCDCPTLAYPCNEYTRHQPLAHRQFKLHLYKATADYFGIELGHLIRIATDRTLKEERSTRLYGLSPRSALIHVSERYLKHLYGLDYLGRQEAAAVLYEWKQMPQFDVVYSDGGFISELMPLKEVFDIVCIIRLHREGFTFNGDSRNYIYPDYLDGLWSYDVTLKDNEITEGVNKIIDIYKRIKIA